MWGRLFTMVYALFGIPLGLVLFNSIGRWKEMQTLLNTHICFQENVWIAFPLWLSTKLDGLWKQNSKRLQRWEKLQFINMRPWIMYTCLIMTGLTQCVLGWLNYGCDVSLPDNNNDRSHSVLLLWEMGILRLLVLLFRNSDNHRQVW